MIYISSIVYNHSTQKWETRRDAAIGSYVSLIWTRRYDEPGDFELVVPGSHPKADLIVPGSYITRDDDPMIVRIEQVERSTGPQGSRIIASGSDILGLLRRRIVWEQTLYHDTPAIDVIRELIFKGVVSPTSYWRIIDFFKVITNDASGVSKIYDAQYYGANLGETVFALCREQGIGIRARMDDGQIEINTYRGGISDHDLIFSPRVGNVNKMIWIEHDAEADVILEAAPAHGTMGVESMSYRSETYSGVDRWETFEQSGDVPTELTYQQLAAIWPIGQHTVYGQTSKGGWVFVVKAGYLTVPLPDDDLRYYLEDYDPSGTVTEDASGQWFFTFGVDVELGIFAVNYPDVMWTVDDSVALNGVYVKCLLSQQAATTAATIKSKNRIEADLDWSAYDYRTDYDVGDHIRIDDGAGHTARALIREMIESFDDKGRKLQPVLVVEE